jgi:hypothetical protein
MQNDFYDILILINVGQKLKKNAQYIFYLHIFHQRLPNMVKRLFAGVIHDAIWFMNINESFSIGYILLIFLKFIYQQYCNCIIATCTCSVVLSK